MIHPSSRLHGDQDALVPVEQARKLDEKMKAVGASHTLDGLRGTGTRLWRGVSGEGNEGHVGVFRRAFEEVMVVCRLR